MVRENFEKISRKQQEGRKRKRPVFDEELDMMGTQVKLARLNNQQEIDKQIKGKKQPN